jgi:hypothetical protein
MLSVFGRGQIAHPVPRGSKDSLFTHWDSNKPGNASFLELHSQISQFQTLFLSSDDMNLVKLCVPSCCSTLFNAEHLSWLSLLRLGRWVLLEAAFQPFRFVQPALMTCWQTSLIISFLHGSRVTQLHGCNSEKHTLSPLTMYVS